MCGMCAGVLTAIHFVAVFAIHYLTDGAVQLENQERNSQTKLIGMGYI